MYPSCDRFANKQIYLLLRMGGRYHIVTQLAVYTILHQVYIALVRELCVVLCCQVP